jgi:hypothetical protein
MKSILLDCTTFSDKIILRRILLLCGILTGLEATQLAANQPTPWNGVLERINIFGYFLWVVVLAFMLLQLEKIKNS